MSYIDPHIFQWKQGEYGEAGPYLLGEAGFKMEKKEKAAVSFAFLDLSYDQMKNIPFIL